MRFYLGTHCPNHVAEAEGDWFLSRYRLFKRKSLPRPLSGHVVVDVGGFTALDNDGDYPITDREWAAEARRYHQEMGGVDWFPPRDWMCEPWIVNKTGLSVREHQTRTLHSYLDLVQIAPDLPWAPVLQGWEVGDYERHVDLYLDHGVSLIQQPIVGVGSVCRRQNTSEAEAIFRRLAGFGLRLHGFGVKVSGLRRYADQLSSADSMAWSFDARRAPPLEGCTSHKNCANCIRYALRWRDQVLASVADAARQVELRREGSSVSDDESKGPVHVQRGTGDVTVRMSLENASPSYRRHAELHELRHNRNPVMEKVVELLDKYVAAYDQRQQYEGSPIADDGLVDYAYNGMLRREEERVQAFINRTANAPEHVKTPGLGLTLTGGVARLWLMRVAEAGEKREQVRREVLREIKTLAREE